jgi:glucose-1-phosphate cytidylyltransferase
MKLVILAGGLGTRISEESSLKPKPMIEIGGKPILWHIMKYYSCFGINEFVICCGYKSYVIKEYFANYHLHQSNFCVNTIDGTTEIYDQGNEDWKVNLIDTGKHTMTGGRLKRISQFVGDTFCMTYGDGLSNIDISKLIEFHEKSGLEATVSAVKPPGRFGALEIENGKAKRFLEKPQGDGSYINGGFFVLNKSVLDKIKDDSTVFEKDPLRSLAEDGQLATYIHDGFWQPMDTLREKNILEKLFTENNAEWKIW